MIQRTKWFALVLAFAALMLVAGCKKKAAPAPPAPPPPPPAAPTATLSASPETIEKGQSSTLTWSTTNATEVTINGAAVATSGSQAVSPADSSTYRLVARGAGGTTDATARVTVTTPPPPPPPQPTVTDEQAFASSVKDIYFDYDSYDLRPQDQQVASANAAFLAQHPNIRFTIEGHCDERGSTEYNLALGDNRANAAKQALIQAGVAADRIRTISYGKEKPVCTEQNEACYQQNRRAHFVFGQK